MQPEDWGHLVAMFRRPAAHKLSLLGYLVRVLAPLPCALAPHTRVEMDCMLPSALAPRTRVRSHGDVDFAAWRWN